MRAVDALMECLKAEGVDVVFGLPGRRQPAHLRRLRGRGYPPHPGPPRGGRRPRRGGLREGHRQGRRGVRHQRPRGHQPADPDHRRDDGLGPGRVHHRPGAHRPARHRRLPGGRHDRHHDAGRQALGDDPEPAGAAAGDPRGIPARPHRPSRPGAGGHPPGPLAGGHLLRAGPGRAPARLPAPRGGQPEADPPGRQGARRRPAPGDLRRWRGRQRQRLARAARLRHLRQVPDHVHADGPGRVPGAAPAVAGDARHARHADGQLRDGRGRPDLRRRGPLRRPHHRQAVRVRPAREVHPHRRGPGRDLQERPRPHPDRGRRQTRARQARRGVPRDRSRSRAGWTRGGRGSRPGGRSTRSATRTPPTPRSSPSS